MNYFKEKLSNWKNKISGIEKELWETREVTFGKVPYACNPGTREAVQRKEEPEFETSLVDKGRASIKEREGEEGLSLTKKKCDMYRNCLHLQTSTQG
jgi:hypothetical protein